jgi:hypothetical protein
MLLEGIRKLLLSGWGSIWSKPEILRDLSCKWEDVKQSRTIHAASTIIRK